MNPWHIRIPICGIYPPLCLDFLQCMDRGVARDMALFKFTKAILNGDPIDVYNHGDMYRDFTYIEDLVKAIMLLIDAVPGALRSNKSGDIQDNLSPVAPFRVVNIGNSDKVKLLDFIKAIEQELGIESKKNLMPMQVGDVPATWANTDLP